MTSAFSDQKLLSARRNSRLPNSQPSAATAKKSAIGTMPISGRRYLPGKLPDPRRGYQRHEPDDHGRHDEQDEPGDDQLGEADLAEQAARHGQSELDLVLDASSSMSPCRGSTNGFMRPILEKTLVSRPR